MPAGDDRLLAALADLVVKAAPYGEQDGDYVFLYLLPTGPVHRAIVLLQEYGVIVRPGFDGRRSTPPEQKMTAPSIGRTVHYVSYGTPGGEYTSQCRAAIVTEVGDPASVDADLAKVGLAVLNPEGMFFNRGVTYAEVAETPGQPDCPDRAEHGVVFRYCACGWLPVTPRGGTWHWPERV